MEPRKITIVSQKTNCTKTITSTATTLAELKKELDANNIDHSGCMFTEGLSRTKFTSEDQHLPLSVMYKGTEKRDLLFMLAITSEKIQSGK